MNKTKLYKNWIAYLTLSKKEVKRFLRIWVQTLIPPVITTTLYFMIFGKLIGDRVGQIGGVSYIEYIAPGLIMMSVVTNSYANVSSSFFGTKYHKNIEEQLVSPMPDSLIILGYVTGGVLRAMLVGFIVAIVALFFTKLHVLHLFSMILVAFLTATTFALGGFLNGLYAKSFDDVTIIPTFILTPLTYLGGIFYSTSMLPDFWQGVSKLNPVLYVVNGFRYSILGVSDVSFGATIVVLICTTISFYLLAIYLMKNSSSLRY